MTIPAFALLREVMDKDASIPGLWMGAPALGGLGFVLARRWPWPALPILLLLALGAAGAWSE